MFMVEASVGKYKWFRYIDDDSTEFDEHNDTYDVTIDKDEIVGIEIKRNHVLMITEYFGSSVKFKLDMEDWESFQRDLAPASPIRIEKKGERLIDYQIARDGDNDDAIDYYTKLWKWVNKKHFGGAMKLPTIKLLRAQKAGNFRKRAHWNGHKREMAFAKRLLNVGEEYVLNVVKHEMCVTGDALIPTDKGLVRMDQIQEVGAKFVLDRKGSTPIKKWWASGTKRVLKIKTETGNELSVSKNHRILVLNNNCRLKWIKAKDLQLGDHVVQRFGSQFKKQTDIKMTKRIARLLGYMAAEGNFTDGHNRNLVYFGNSNLDLIKDFQKCWKSCFGYKPEIKFGKEIKAGKFYIIREQSAKVAQWFEAMGFLRDLAPNKSVPTSILQSDLVHQKHFLRAFIEGDGYLCPFGGIDISSASKEMLVQLKLMMLNLGIISKLEPKSAKGTYNENGTYWRLRTFDTLASAEIIGVVSEKRKAILDCARTYHNNKTQSQLGKHWKIPFIYNWLRSKSKDYVSGIRKLEAGKLYPKDVIASLANIQKRKTRKKVKNLLGTVVYEQVVSIEVGYKELVYDMETGSHEFVANGLVIHNCHQAVTEIDKLGYQEINKGHGPFWKGWMKKIGMSPDQYDSTSNVECMDPEEKENHAQLVQRITEAGKLYAPYRSPPGVLQPVAIFLAEKNEWVFGLTICPTSNNLKAKKWVVAFQAGSNYYYEAPFNQIRKVDSAKAAEIMSQQWKQTVYNLAASFFGKQRVRSGKDILSFTPVWYPSVKRWLEANGMRF